MCGGSAKVETMTAIYDFLLAALDWAPALLFSKDLVQFMTMRTPIESHGWASRAGLRRCGQRSRRWQ
jgi:hypothetical protein